MLSLSSPLWLLSIVGVVPLIRWLHRFHDVRTAIPVPALFLWRAQVQAESAGNRPDSPDPRWRLRALVALTLLLALAGPRWNSPLRQPVEVWLDDSLSMFTVEGGESRIRTAIGRLVDTLRVSRPASILIHSLGNPGVSLQLDASAPDSWLPVLSAWTQVARGRPMPPAAVQMRSDAEHWLLSDGADAVLRDWLAGAAISRVFQVGERSDNVAITRLAVRPALIQDTEARAIVTVSNLSERPQQRTLHLFADDRRLHRQQLSLAAGTSLSRNFAVPRDAVTSLQAKLAPHDGLTSDDDLQLNLEKLAPIAVHLQGSCGTHVQTALKSHPRLVIDTANGGADVLTVSCASQPPAVAAPAIRIHTPDNPQAPATAARWTPASGQPEWPTLDPAWLSGEARHAPGAGAVTLFGTADTTLIAVSDSKPAVIDVYLDLEHAELVVQPEYPALIDSLIGFALDRRLLEETVAAGRSSEESRIAPRTLRPGVLPGRSAAAGSAAQDLSMYLIVLCAVLLLFDTVLAVRVAGAAVAAPVHPGG